MTDRDGLVKIDEAWALVQAEAAAEREAAEPGADDPCAWVGGTPQWIRLMTKRASNPLPIAGYGNPNRAALFDPQTVREWFAEEFERRAAATEATVIGSQSTGILLTASMLARELGMHPQTLARRLREYNVQPARVGSVSTYYRLCDMLSALTAAQRVEDPDSLPPSDRDAHWRAEARKDDVLKTRRELVQTREAVGVLNALASLLRDACDLIPDALESRCQLSSAALAVVEREIDNVRSQIATRVRELHELLRNGSLSASPALEAEQEAA